MSGDQKKALQVVAKGRGWDQMPVGELGVLLWALFHFYAKRRANG